MRTRQAGSLFDKLSEAGAKLCVKTMEAIENGTAVYTPQDDALATHTGKIQKEMGSIDWSKDAEVIELSGARLKSMAECIYKDR